MRHYEVPEMSCGHCAAAIEKALKAVDPLMVASFDLEKRTLAIESVHDAASIAAAIEVAGCGSEVIAV